MAGKQVKPARSRKAVKKKAAGRREKKIKYEFNELISFKCKATVAGLVPVIEYLFVKYFKVSESVATETLKGSFTDYIKQLVPGLDAFIEYPYVDRMYRDTYYNFFAKKLRTYSRDTIRISFFKKGIKETDFISPGDAMRLKIQQSYMGFLVLRPVFPQIIGRNILSRKAVKSADFLCCGANFKITVNSVKLELRGYPHASQDNQSIKCAETSLWALLEYFGNKFPDYTPVLPSKIYEILSSYAYKRLVPSDGLSGEQLGYSLRELGFGPVMALRIAGYAADGTEILDKHFDAAISVYIESGLPVLGLIKGDGSGHCINIMGREADDLQKILAADKETLANGTNIIDYNNVPRRYVVMDDNLSPFGKINLNDPCELYVDKKKKRLPGWEDCKLNSVIVPLPHKVYLDAQRARYAFKNILAGKKYGLNAGGPYVVKFFIATSRTYKDYIAKGDMHPDVKQHFLNLPMSKFIYVAEISTLQAFKGGKCNSILLLDATELFSKEGKDPPIPFLAGYNNLLTLGREQKGKEDALFFRQDFGNYKEIATFARPFKTFRENLMD